MESTIDRSVKELRRIVAGLRPITLDELGLIPALDEALKSLKAEGIVCHLTSAGRLVRLPPSVELSIYRIILEALNNVRKHANATTVDLKLDFHRNDLLVEIHDNGKGFNLSETLNSALSVGHMGLLGMKQRTEIVGGTLEIKTGRRIGTSVLLRLPLQSQA